VNGAAASSWRPARPTERCLPPAPDRTWRRHSRAVDQPRRRSAQRASRRRVIPSVARPVRPSGFGLPPLSDASAEQIESLARGCADPQDVIWLQTAGRGHLTLPSHSLSGLDPVGLGGDHLVGEPVMGEPLQVLEIQPGGSHRTVHEGDDHHESLPSQQIGLNHRCPTGADPLGHLRVPVAGKVDHRRAAPFLEQVEQLGPAGSPGDLRQVTLVGERVQQRGLAHVRPPDDGDLGRGGGEPVQRGCGGDEPQRKRRVSGHPRILPRPSRPRRLHLTAVDFRRNPSGFHRGPWTAGFPPRPVVTSPDRGGFPAESARVPPRSPGCRISTAGTIT
jgi:hypothetical protein